jgi:tetratricopeptide (TPR) repeat protein
VKRLFCSIGLLVSIFLSQEALAQDSDLTFQAGKRAFEAGRYEAAIKYLQAAEAQAASYDARPMYYEALCNYRLGHTANGRQIMMNLIQKFPDSEAAELARKSLSIGKHTYTPGELAKLKTMKMDVLPKVLSLKAQDKDGKPLVEVDISGHKIKMILDPSQTQSRIGRGVADKNKLSDVATDAKAASIEKTDKEAGAYVLYDINLNGIQRPSFPVFLSFADHDVCVLGNDFLNGYDVSYADGTVKITRQPGFTNPFGVGMKYFNEGRFKEALPLLKKATMDRPQDPRPLYCLAVCSQKLGLTEDAKGYYKNIRNHFGNSEASYLAGAALEQIDPVYRAQQKGPDASSRAAKLIKEQSFEVPYVIENSRYRVRVYVDNVPTEMYAEFNNGDCIFNVDQINSVDTSYLNSCADYQVKDPDPMGNDSVVSTTYRIKLKTVRFGNAEEHNVPTTVVEEHRRGRMFAMPFGGYPRPILGGYIVRNWRWEIDPSRKMLKVWRPQPQ